MAVSKSHKSKEPSSIAKTYLIAYNFLQVLGWSYILYQWTLFHLKKTPRGTTLWENVQFAVNVFQNAAALEIIHAFTGMVKSNPIITTFQVLSRVIVVCAVILATPPTYAAASYGLPLALLAWSITEIIRYGYYFANLLGSVPEFLVWLRYTTFIVLYPIGVTGELLCFYAASKYAKVNEDAWSYTLPNSLNFTFSYHYFLLTMMILYIPFFPRLYLHMFTQRNKILGPSKPSDKKIS